MRKQSKEIKRNTGLRLRPQDCKVLQSLKKAKIEEKQNVFPKIVVMDATNQEKNIDKAQLCLYRQQTASNYLKLDDTKLNRQHSFSQNKSRRDFQGRERAKSQIKDQNISIAPQLTQTELLSDELFRSMSKNVVFTTKANMISIKKESFQSMLASLVGLIIGEANQGKDQNWLKDVRVKLNNISRKNKLNKAKKKLGLSSKTTFRTINPYYMRGQFQKETVKMTSLISQRQSLESQVQILEDKHEYLKKIWQQKREETTDYEKRTYEAKQQIIKDTETLKNLKESIASNEAELARLEKKGQDIRDFVFKQSTPLMLYVGSEFRQIEEDMIDYAAYLHWDPLYSSMMYEPIPFAAIEKDMLEDLKWGVIDLKQKDKPLEPKITQMVELVNSFYRRFNLKDQQLTRVNTLKTKCIQKFYDMMLKWASYHSIKKDTLVDLRKSFVIDSQIIEECLTEFMNDQTLTHQHKTIQKMKKSWQKIKQNYKTGNYFY